MGERRTTQCCAVGRMREDWSSSDEWMNRALAEGRPAALVKQGAEPPVLDGVVPGQLTHEGGHAAQAGLVLVDPVGFVDPVLEPIEHLGLVERRPFGPGRL